MFFQFISDILDESRVKKLFFFFFLLGTDLLLRLLFPQFFFLFLVSTTMLYIPAFSSNFWYALLVFSFFEWAEYNGISIKGGMD